MKLTLACALLFASAARAQTVSIVYVSAPQVRITAGETVQLAPSRATPPATLSSNAPAPRGAPTIRPSPRSTPEAASRQPELGWPTLPPLSAAVRV